MALPLHVISFLVRRLEFVSHMLQLSIQCSDLRLKVDIISHLFFLFVNSQLELILNCLQRLLISRLIVSDLYDLSCSRKMLLSHGVDLIRQLVGFLFCLLVVPLHLH